MSTTTIETPKYALLIEWDAKDQIFIGRCPGLFGGGVHGKDREKVFGELCQAVDEVIEASARLGISLPQQDAAEGE